MTTSNAIADIRIGPVEMSLLKSIDRTRNRIWTISTSSLPRDMTADQARQALSRLADAGLLDRIERGAYLVHPRSGRVPMLPLDLIGAWLGKEPHSVIGWAAAEAHDLTQQTASNIEVQLTREKDPIVFDRIRYLFTEAEPALVSADNVKVSTKSGSASVASPGKTVVLLLRQESARRSARPRNDTRLVLEMLERGKAKGIWKETDWPRLVRRHGSAQVARRLGHLLEFVGVDGAEDLLPLRGRSGNTPFAPALPSAGPISTRWRLVLNDPAIRS
jgi:predicted transcriptional regulator of viral defense system